MKPRLTLAALLLTLPLLAQTVQAHQADPYTLSCSGTNFISPFTVDHTVLQGGASGRTVPILYEFTGQDGHRVSVYSADAGARTPIGAGYRRMNLEDSAYFSDTTAGKLRAIVKKGYPMVAVETLQEEANLWLRAMGLPEIQNLQSGEAVSAAQIALWKLACGSGYSVNALFGGVLEPEEGVEPLPQQETENTAKNIESLYTYFCNLEPMEPVTVLLSDASITRTVYASSRETGYIATVSVTVTGTVEEGDEVIVSAACEDQLQEQPFTESGTYTFTFSGLSSRGAVTITLSGTQHGADVYLFDAKGEREAAQTLIGYDDGAQLIYSERILTPVPSDPLA